MDSDDDALHIMELPGQDYQVLISQMERCNGGYIYSFSPLIPALVYWWSAVGPLEQCLQYALIIGGLIVNIAVCGQTKNVCRCIITLLYTILVYACRMHNYKLMYEPAKHW